MLKGQPKLLRQLIFSIVAIIAFTAFPCCRAAADTRPALIPKTLDDFPLTMEEYEQQQGITCPGVAPDAKVLPLATIVVGFNNVPYEDGYDWSDHLFRSQKSLQQYYLDMSYQQMTFVPVKENSAYQNEGNTCVEDRIDDGIIHVNMNLDHKDWSYHDAENEYYDGERLMVLVMEEAEKFWDFSAYDLNGNGEIEDNEMRQENRPPVSPVIVSGTTG